MTDPKPRAIDDAIHQMFLRVGEHRLKAFMGSWFMAEKDERRKRLALVMELSVELERIREHSIFATGTAVAAIEAVIEGDLAGMKIWAESFSFEEEGEDIRTRYAPLWRSFRETLEAACVIAEARDRAPVTA